MGIVSLPIAIFLYWLMLHYKKDDPFPKWGVIFLVLAGIVSPLLASQLYTPVSSVAEVIYGTENPKSTFLWNLINMFLTAGLIEEGLKYLSCRAATIKEGMLRTWMDCVIAFSTVGITFDFIENMVYGMRSGLIGALARAVAPGHFIFGVLMGYLYGKFRVSGQKKYHWLCYIVPVICHTITNAFLQSADLGGVYLYLATATGIGFVVAAVVTICKVIRWQKNKTLEIPIDARGE